MLSTLVFSFLSSHSESPPRLQQLLEPLYSPLIFFFLEDSQLLWIFSASPSLSSSSSFNFLPHPVPFPPIGLLVLFLM